MTNKELTDIVFDKIKSFGFKIYDIHHVDGYFVFEGAKDSVTHFRLKGHGMWKHWGFGIWVHTEYMDEKFLSENTDEDYSNRPIVEIFAQHDTLVDKFKPSASDICISLYKGDIQAIERNDPFYPFYKLESMLMMMCRHPFLCYNGFCGSYAGYNEDSFILEYIKSESRETFKKIKLALCKAFWVPYTRFKIALSKRNKIIDNLELYDFNKENPGWSTSYLYEVRIRFKENVSADAMCKWMNHWWKKDDYGFYTTYNKVIRVDSLTQVGCENRFRLE